MNKYIKIAIQEGEKALRKNEGGPFGAVIVKKGKIIATGRNKVIKTNDPTAHAEMDAIRKATKKLKRFDLSDCEIYSSCEPCPMCFSAIHWARIKKLYFGCTRKDAEKAGFNDKLIYDILKGTSKKKQVKSIHLDREECLALFKEWKKKKDKVQY